uniref:Pre-mRNA splicing Prp18-interacting factor n=1 Tax=Tanacetum cinerariifolium TaxID=118510 RepID=A0A6L2NAV2_TANCI|nr:hypothetical protein [Tanacetum cinerariifolium]
MSWFSRCSWCGGLFNSGNCWNCTNVSSRDEPVYDSNPYSYNQTPDFSNPLPHHDYETDSSGNCPSCSIVGAGNEFVHDPNPFPYDNTPDFYDQPPQHHVETYSCKLRGNNSYYGYDFPPRFPLVYEQEPCYNQNFVEDLVPIPKESKDTSDSDKECNLTFCDNSMTFSNPLFDLNDDSTSIDDESLSDEDVLEDNVKIYSNPLFEFDDEYISSDVNPLFDEMLEDIENKESHVSNPDEPVLLVTPLSDANEDECFDPRGDVDKINTFDIPSDFKDGYYDSEGDVLYLESLLSDDTNPNLPLEVFLDRDLRSLSDINDLKIMVKVFDPGIPEKFFSPTYASLPFKDRHYLFLTYVIRIVLPYFTYLVDSPFLLSSESEDTIFDPDISAFHFYSLKPVASHRSGTFICFNVYPNILNESLMEICSSTRFNPNITMIWGESN